MKDEKNLTHWLLPVAVCSHRNTIAFDCVRGVPLSICPTELNIFALPPPVVKDDSNAYQRKPSFLKEDWRSKGKKRRK